MGTSILPSGEELKTTPEQVLKYLNPDGLRQLLRQERLHWLLKPNKDADFYDNQHLWRFSGALHNEVRYQRMEIRTFPDNDGMAGYAGINVDSGLFGIVHNLEKWDETISAEGAKAQVNKVQIGAMARIKGKEGLGLNRDMEMDKKTDERIAAMLFDPYDGRAYLYSNDDTIYTNNETRAEKLPKRTVARICDIPTRITDLENDLDFVADPDYRHTDNNFTDSNRYVVDNMDDRTFVYPEIAKDRTGEYLTNRRFGLNGEFNYGESDERNSYSTQFGFEDRIDNVDTSIGYNKRFSGVDHPSGYFPGIFRSVEELNKVDLLGQKKTLRTQKESPGARRDYNFYIFDGIWSPNWFDRYMYKDSYLAQSMMPSNMEVILDRREPVPFTELSQKGDIYKTTQLYQWRYNRISITYDSSDVVISIVKAGQEYKVGDILRWTFADDVFLYEVTSVGSGGQIQTGKYHPLRKRIFEQSPGTNGVGIPFKNTSGVGHGALLAVSCNATVKTNATQIKNNLYAYVDITPSVRSNNSSEWSDTNRPDTQDGRINVRSTAAAPAYSGINSGRGGPSGSINGSQTIFHEHGGNATAGVHVHLFRYVINTQNPTWVIRDGVQVFTGAWVDQGPMGVERPCDIKALFLSNPDTNNFNNYYKFMLDTMIDSVMRNHDASTSNNPNTVTKPYLHVAQRDPEPNQKFTDCVVDPITSKVKDVDITDRVIYINGATGVTFMYNSSPKNDPSFGYGSRKVGWYPLAGAITR